MNRNKKESIPGSMVHTKINPGMRDEKTDNLTTGGNRSLNILFQLSILINKELPLIDILPVLLKLATEHHKKCLLSYLRINNNNTAALVSPNEFKDAPIQTIIPFESAFRSIIKQSFAGKTILKSSCTRNVKIHDVLSPLFIPKVNTIICSHVLADEYTIDLLLIAGTGGKKWEEEAQVLINDLTGLIRNIDNMLQVRNLKKIIADDKLKYLTLFKSMKRGVIYQDKNGVITAANPAAEKILGLSEDKLKGMLLTDQIWKSTNIAGRLLQIEAHPVTIALRTGKTVNNVVLGITNQHTGKIKWISIASNPEISLTDNKFLHLFTVFEDITQHRRIIEELRRSEEKYRRIVDQSLVGVYQTTFSGEFLYANQALVRLLEYDSQIDIMKSDSIMHYKRLQDREKLINELKKNNGKIDSYEVELLTRKKRNIVVLISAVLIEKSISGMIIDITDRKDAENEILISKGNLEAVLKNEDISIWSVDNKLNILTMNSLFKKEFDDLFHFIPSEGDNLIECLPDEIRAGWKRKMNRVLKGEKIKFEENIRQDTLRTWEVSMNPIYHHGKVTGISIFSTEITKKKIAEAAVKLNEERLEGLLEMYELKGFSEEKITTFALDKAVQMTGSTVGYLHFINEDQKTIQLNTWSTGTLKRCSAAKESHYPIEQAGIWVESFYQRKPVIHNDYINYPLKKGYPEGHIHLQRHLSVPIFDGKHIVALAGVGNKNDPYDKNDIRQLSLFMNSMWGILKRNRTENALSVSEEKYRSFVLNFQGIAFRCKIDWTPLFFHGAVEKITGYSEWELLQRKPDWINIVHPDDLETVFSRYPADIFTNPGFSAEREYRIIRKDGEIRWVHDVIHTRSDENGKPLHINGAIFDVSDRKQTEQQLETIFNISDDLISIASLDGYFLKINPAFNKLLGYTDEELLSRPFVDFVATEDKEKTVKVIEDELKKGKTLINFQNRYICKDGTVKWLDWNSRPIPEVNMTFAVARDVTHQKQSEAELMRMMKELERSNRDLEEFAYVASHDLQEPLRKIKGFTYLFANRFRDKIDDTADRYIDYITDGTQRMQNLIKDLLMLSRITTRGKAFEETNLNDCVAGATENLELLIRENQAVITSDPLPSILVDKTQMIQLFQNLLSNAIKFRKTNETPEIHISIKEKPGHWIFKVKDNGIGVEMKHADRIFVIFQRLHTREEYPGTGMGLALCKKIVERHRGQISVKSSPGKGSTFRFTISKQI